MVLCLPPHCPVGISSETILKSSNTSEEELLDLIYKLNTDHQVDGLLIQLPLPGTHSPSRTTTHQHVHNIPGGRVSVPSSTRRRL